LDWKAREEVMVKPWRAAGKNVDRGAGPAGPVSFSVPRVAWKRVKGWHSRSMEEYLNESVVARLQTLFGGNMSSNQFTRREFVKASGLAALAGSIPAAAQDKSNQKSNELLLYVGTYTRGKSEGIYVYRMNLSGGELKHAATVKGV